MLANDLIFQKLIFPYLLLRYVCINMVKQSCTSVSNVRWFVDNAKAPFSVNSINIIIDGLLNFMF